VVPTAIWPFELGTQRGSFWERFRKYGIVLKVLSYPVQPSITPWRPGSLKGSMIPS